MVDSAPTRLPVSKPELASARSTLAADQVSKASSAVDQATDQGRQRRASSQQRPGIQVTLDSLERNPQLDQYRNLNSDGRRKDESHLEDVSSLHGATAGSAGMGPVTIEASSNGESQPRSIPRSKAILDNFIEQMGGAELSQTRGNLVNISI